MDFVEQSGVNISHSVMISGVANTSADDEILDFLRSYGPLRRVLPVNDPKSTFYKNLIAEFEEADAFSEVNSLLPYKHKSRSAADRVYSVTALANEYTATARSSNPTPDYLNTFKEIADSSGIRFEDVLKTVMDQIHHHLKTESRVTNNDDMKEEAEEDVLAQPVPKLQPLLPQLPTEPVGTGSTQRLSLSHDDLNPPGVQRVVVEHLVRNTDLSAPVALRLRSFSGRIPKPSNEADFESWRSQIDLLLADPNMSLLHVTRRIIESLLAPAADLVKGCGPDTLPTVLIRILDSAFGTVQDGEELYAQFLNILQNPGERPSAYLQRLQLMLSSVVKRGGISATEMDKQLIKQFVRGCWDNAIITKLHLEQRRENPPLFSELLLLLRTEEDRQQAKESLMKKHIGSGSFKQKANIQSQSSCSCDHTQSSSNEIGELKKQMQQLQRQMSAFLSAQKSPAELKPAPRQSSRLALPSAVKPKPWYCFNCGEDGHISSSCSNAPNPSLVEQKKKELRKKQQAWVNNTTPLNDKRLL